MPTTLERRIRELKRERDILLISHAVLGYPSLEADRESIDEMMAAGVELIELQIPFSDPQADGPFFTKANQCALDGGATLEPLLQFAEETCRRHPSVSFLFMTYFNILFKYGVPRFVHRAAQAGIQGIIVPDLPIEEAGEYAASCLAEDVAPVFMVAPTTPAARITETGRLGGGFLYCQAREGVTGSRTRFDDSIATYIDRCRQATDLPLAVGFGIQAREDVAFLKGRADIAICCTQAVRVLVERGPKAMGTFLRDLR